MSVFICLDTIANHEIIQKKRNVAELRECFTTLIETRMSTSVLSEELTERRNRVNKATIGTSATGIAGGIMAIVGLVLIPVSFGTSLGLSIAGAAIGIGSGVVQGGFRVHEAVTQNSSSKELNEKITELHEHLGNLLVKFHNLFFPTDHSHVEPTILGMNQRGFMSVGNVFRSMHSVAGIVLPAARVSATAATAAAAIIGPVSMGLDIAFLGEAVYNMTAGENHSGATELLECSIAFQTILLAKYLGDCSIA